MHSWPTRVTVGIAIVAASTWAQGGPAAACSCAESSEVESFGLASAVFVGEVIDVWSQPPPKSGEYSSDLPRWFTFSTTAVYKGDAFEEQSVRTVVDGDSCGMELGGRGPFLIFAVGPRDGGELRSGLCDGNRAIGTTPVPDAFGAPRQPLAGPSPSSRPGAVDETVDRSSADGFATAIVTSEPSPSLPGWVIPANIALLVLAGAVFTVVRRSRSAG